jgi:CMP-N-acetylneuraminic acid synthetase
MLSSTGAWVPAFAPDFKVTNRQQISEYKFITGGIYVFSKRFIEEHGSLVVTGKTQFYDCGPLSGVDIDNLQDLLIARALFEFGLSNF